MIAETPLGQASEVAIAAAPPPPLINAGLDPTPNVVAAAAVAITGQSPIAVVRQPSVVNSAAAVAASGQPQVAAAAAAAESAAGQIPVVQSAAAVVAAEPPPVVESAPAGQPPIAVARQPPVVESAAAAAAAMQLPIPTPITQAPIAAVERQPPITSVTDVIAIVRLGQQELWEEMLRIRREIRQLPEPRTQYSGPQQMHQFLDEEFEWQQRRMPYDSRSNYADTLAQQVWQIIYIILRT